MLEFIQYTVAIPILVYWLSLLREPGEILSWYDKILIGLDERLPIIHKTLTCSFCHVGYISIFCIFAYDIHWFILPLSMVFFKVIIKDN